MEFFRNVNVDWMAKKWYFLGFSLIVTVAGLLSILFWHHVPWGVDFKGGTIVQVRFHQKPDIEKIRQLLRENGAPDSQPQELAGRNDVLIEFQGAKEEDQTKSLKSHDDIEVRMQEPGTARQAVIRGRLPFNSRVVPRAERHPVRLGSADLPHFLPGAKWCGGILRYMFAAIMCASFPRPIPRFCENSWARTSPGGLAQDLMLLRQKR